MTDEPLATYSTYSVVDIRYYRGTLNLRSMEELSSNLRLKA